MAVDLDPTPGRFLITGSTNFLTVPTLSESLAGRVGIVELWPFSQGELAGVGPETFTRLAFDDPDAMRPDLWAPIPVTNIWSWSVPVATPPPGASPRPSAVVGIGTTSTRSPNATSFELADIRRVDAIPPVLGTVAALTGQELNVARLARGVGLDPRTVNSYLAWLATVFLVHRVPKWSRNLSTKAAKASKLYVADSGLAATLTNKDPVALARPTDTSVGGLVETFAANEVAKQLTWDDAGARLHHYRDHDGPEIDLILETPDGRIVAIEVKAAISPGSDATRWLTWLRDRLDRVGDDFVHGFVLHTGRNRVSLGDRLTLLPLDALWTPADTPARRLLSDQSAVRSGAAE